MDSNRCVICIKSCCGKMECYIGSFQLLYSEGQERENPGGVHFAVGTPHSHPVVETLKTAATMATVEASSN